MESYIIESETYQIDSSEFLCLTSYGDEFSKMTKESVLETIESSYAKYELLKRDNRHPCRKIYKYLFEADDYCLIWEITVFFISCLSQTEVKSAVSFSNKSQKSFNISKLQKLLFAKFNDLFSTCLYKKIGFSSIYMKASPEKVYEYFIKLDFSRVNNDEISVPLYKLVQENSPKIGSIYKVSLMTRTSKRFSSCYLIKLRKCQRESLSSSFEIELEVIKRLYKSLPRFIQRLKIIRLSRNSSFILLYKFYEDNVTKTRLESFQRNDNRFLFTLKAFLVKC